METVDKAFLVHRRAYRDSKIIVELFTREHGKVSGVLRVSQNKKQYQPVPQQFTPLFIRWKGLSSLKTILSIETLTKQLSLQATSLYCGMYLNELLTRLCAEEDGYPEIFDCYQQTLECLNNTKEKPIQEGALRKFEMTLLSVLGYGVNFELDTLGNTIDDSIQTYYRFIAAEGFLPITLNQKQAGRAGAELAGENIFSGQAILGVARYDWSDSSVLLSAKVICRISLRLLLGNKPLASRELFR